MSTLIRTRATGAWALLIALTVVSWALGTDHGLGQDSHQAASLVIIAVAVFKIRLVGLYFMELRVAPTALRALFEGYCTVLLGVVAGMYLFA